VSDQSSDQYLSPYREAIQRFGPGFEATLWHKRESQVLRFDVMIDLVDFTGCAVVDAGCGQGDFARHLLDRDVPFARYVGIDAIDEMVQQAQLRDLPQCRFVTGDFVRDVSVIAAAQPDYVCLSGTLNTMDDDMARRLIRGAYDAAAQGVVFNYLSDRPHARFRGRDLTPARRFDTMAWLDWAFELSSRVAFTQEYLDGHDATILIRHDESMAE